jgi:hypothetical protein
VKSIWYTYRVKVAAEKGTMELQEAFSSLVTQKKIEAVEFLRATPAKESA